MSLGEGELAERLELRLASIPWRFESVRLRVRKVGSRSRATVRAGMRAADEPPDSSADFTDAMEQGAGG